MIYNLRKTLAILSMTVLGSIILYNCEPEPDSLGEQLFLDGAANGTESLFDVVGYNISNNDTIRADANTFVNLFGSNAATSSTAVLGAFTENQFGMQKATYFTQLRLPSYDPDFGTNPTVDSVVMVIKPTYAIDSVTTTTNEDYIYPDGNVAAKKVVSTFPITKFGKAKLNGGKLTLQVHEVAEFMNGVNDAVYSNKKFAANESNILGSKEISGNVNSVVITKDADNTEIFKTPVGIRIPLSADFFKQKIIDKKGQMELKDAANFIRHFRGLRVSVVENDGYLFQFTPNDIELIMYYKNEKVENGTTTRPQSKYNFALGSANVHTGYYEYTRAGAAIQTYALGNSSTGDLKLYAQGMGGNSIGIKFPAATINQLKELYKTNKAAIITAKIRLYTDVSVWSNKYSKPTVFTILQRDKDSNGKETTAFTTDYSVLGSASTFIPIRVYDLDKNPAYYDFTVTQSLKDIVESGKDYSNKYFKIDLAQFLSTSAGSLAGYKYTSRPFSMARAVFVGSDPSNANRVQLRVTYGTK
ncbi:DUF4270 family protein [Chryseobacterium echinoideorum]|uniref:DUF4270 family protein n=1 Tax=Chryseobacterium echinoideorum TaxID=1549648 RepID=UPI001E4FCCA9|nr:DUF4270 family protein [Chryseobacterium echinoideorum]